jgi:hypothetical protein
MKIINVLINVALRHPPVISNKIVSVGISRGRSLPREEDAGNVVD